MAYADYRLCDVCGGKAFYDAHLNYEMVETEFNSHRPPYRIAGEVQAEAFGTAMRLDYVGDWVVICDDCAKTHECKIVPRQSTPTTDAPQTKGSEE